MGINEKINRLKWKEKVSGFDLLFSLGTVPVVHVEGVLGHRVEMPCDITPKRRDDTVYMVLCKSTFRNL